jgi:hypothetical protein
MTDKLVVNYFGAPNSGKTVAAASTFSKLKKRHLDTVLINEFATAKVVEENKMALANQLFIWANQQYQIFCGYNHAQVVVTDSPILLGAIYNTQAHPALYEVIFQEHKKFNNLNIMMQLDNSFPYSMVGRIHSFTESLGIEAQIINLLEVNDIPFLFYNQTTEDEIVDLIESSINE